MYVKVLLLFRNTNVTVQPRLTFTPTSFEGPVPTEERIKVRIIDYNRPFLKKTNSSTGPVPCVSLRFPENDIWIAATALETGARLLSYDRHFDSVGGLIRLSP